MCGGSSLTFAQNTRLKQENEAIKQMIKEQKKAADAALASSSAARLLLTGQPADNNSSTPLPSVPHKSLFVMTTPSDMEEKGEVNNAPIVPSSEPVEEVVVCNTQF